MQPGKDLRIEFANGHGGVLGTIGIMLFVNGLHQMVSHIVQSGDIIGKNLCSRHLMGIPIEQSVHGIQVGIDNLFVEVGQMSTINATDTKAAGLDAVLKEIGINRRTHLKLQLLGKLLRDKQLTRRNRIGQMRHLTCH